MLCSPGFFSCEFSQKNVLLWSPCAFRLRRLAQSAWLVMLCSEGLILQARRAHFLSYVMSIFCGKCGTFETFWSLEHGFAWQTQDIGHFSSAWQAWHFRNRANILAGVDPNNIWFWRLFFVARAVFDELGSTIVFCELSSHWNFWHDDDSVWHVQHLGCLALIFRDRRSTL
jgi:hypothetical protein